MKRLLAVAAAFFLPVALVAPSESQTPSHACFSDCSSCVQRCRGQRDRASCERTCREIKRTCCRACGKGPGPIVTCGCT